MDLTSKQRAQLRGLANDIDTIVHIGKDGIGDNLIKQADDALEAREKATRSQTSTLWPLCPAESARVRITSPSWCSAQMRPLA